MKNIHSLDSTCTWHTTIFAIRWPTNIWRMGVTAFLAGLVAGVCAAQPAQSVVTFTTDVDCTWKIDGKTQAPLDAGAMRAVTLSAGYHKLEASSADGYYAYSTTVNAVAGQDKTWKINLAYWHDFNRASALGKIAFDKAVADLAAHPTWTDPATGLMWTRTDNGDPINWYQAVDYCKTLTLGGYSDWRLPEIDELAAIQSFHDPILPWKRKKGTVIFIRGGILLSGWIWSNTPARRPDEAQYFIFDYGDLNQPLIHGGRYEHTHSHASMSALCVRRAGGTARQ